VLDHSASHVQFRGRAAIQRVTGQSRSLGGSITLRGSDLRTARGIVRFPVASLRTQPSADAHDVVRLFGGRPGADVVFEVDSIGRDAHTGPWILHGRRTRNGVSRSVRFAGTALTYDRRLIAEGETRVDLRDWGIRPPQRLRGLIRMSSEMTLSFRAEFQPKTAPSPTQIAVQP
jgi:polyisoprenoid-binding protein YceI